MGIPPAVIISSAVGVKAVGVIVMMPGPVMPGIVIPGIIVPGIPGPAAIVPGTVIPGVIIPGVGIPCMTVPRIPVIIVPQIPGPVPGIGIIQRPERRGVIHHREGRSLCGKTDLGAGGHDQGVALAENIGRGLFAQSKEIVGLLFAYGNLRGNRRRPGVYAVVVDLGLESGHGRAGKGGKGAERICQDVLFHCTTSFNPIKISIFVAGKARHKRYFCNIRTFSPASGTQY